MFLNFFLFLKDKKFPASVTEYLNLLAALKGQVIGENVEDFFYLSRIVFVKNESFLDRYDRLFGEYFKNITNISIELLATFSEDWLKNNLQRTFTDEEKEAVKAMGGLEVLLKRLAELQEEQKERHEGGNKWVGTGGTSPFGNSGYNPEGIRIGGSGGGRTAVKVWDERNFKNYDDELELNTRNMKMAFRRLRILSREGAENEFDLEGTISKTSKNAGMLDIEMRASRKNKVKVLLLLDVGGSMDDYIDLCSQLFSAAKYQFKHIDQLYFHNCIYENLWKDNERRNQRISTWDVLHKYNQDWKVIIVGDASMAPYEISSARGSVEYYNEESGLTWLNRLKDHFPNLVWLNPTESGYWGFTQSIGMVKDWSENRMFPLTISGITEAMKRLKSPHAPGGGYFMGI
jgi:uncharacterized protein